MENVQSLLATGVLWLRMAIEATSALWIGLGFIVALVDLARSRLRSRPQRFTEVRLTFSRYLSLGLEFQLASDILSTSIAPSWTELGKLAATAIIRTGLNYFLSRDMSDFQQAGASLRTIPPAG